MSIFNKIPASRLDLRSLAAFRILFGAYLLFDIYARGSLGKFDLAWYTSDPPNRCFLDPDDTPHKAPLHRIWFHRGTVNFQILAFSLSTCLSLLFCLGLYCNGFVKFLLLLVQVAQHNRTMEVADGSDSFSRHLLLWSCFLPMSEVWSLDVWRTRGSSKKVDVVNSSCVTGLAPLALTTQIVFMYLGTVFHRTIDLYGWSRLSDSKWLPPRLSAVYYALCDTFATRNNWLTVFITSSPAAGRFMTFSATSIEFIVPLFCFLTYRLRHVGALVLFGLHVGLMACFNLPNWQLVGMLTQVLWIPSNVWDAIVPGPSTTSTAGDYSYKKTDGDLLAINQQRLQYRPLTPNPVSLLLQVFFFSYMLYNWTGNRGWIQKHDNGDIGEGLRLSQYWVMYAQVDHRTATSQLIGRTKDDSREVDLYHYIKTHGEEIEPWHEDAVVQDMTSRFPSTRWERAISQWSNGKDRMGNRGKQLCKALCTLLNEDPGSLQFSSVELRYKPLHVLPPGSNFRFAEQQREKQIRPIQSLVATCSL